MSAESRPHARTRAHKHTIVSLFFFFFFFFFFFTTHRPSIFTSNVDEARGPIVEAEIK